MISIVMSAFNRLPQLAVSLASISQSEAVGETELVIVDDGSSPEEIVTEDFVRRYYKGALKLIQLPASSKWYSNPCIPLNRGLSEAAGDLVLIQNPEVLHHGDVLKDIVGHAFEEQELRSYACYALDRSTTARLTSEDSYEVRDAKIGPRQSLPASPQHSRGGAWFNHSIHRPLMLHFASLLTRPLLVALNGFDERFAYGRCADDKELVARIRLSGCKATIVDSPFVAHQWHERVYKGKRSLRRNITLFAQIRAEGFQVRANPHKEIVQ